MKLFVLCIFIAGLVATQAKKCDLNKPQCVELYTGEPEVPDPTKKPVDCEQCRADAIAQSLTQYCYIPICNEDNTFQNYQYDTVKNESFCYTYWGEEIKGSRVEGPGANCTVEEEEKVVPKLPPCVAKKAALALTGNPFKITPECDKDGFFTNNQCWRQGPAPEQEFCWCTQLNGKIIPGTFYLAVTKDVKPDCARHVGIKPVCNKDDVLIPYPSALRLKDCARYISCSPERTFTCICGEGQRFDYKNQECGWEKDVPCALETSTPKVVATDPNTDKINEINALPRNS